MPDVLPAVFLAVPNFTKLVSVETRVSEAKNALQNAGSAAPLLNADQISAAQSAQMIESAYGKDWLENVRGVYFGNDTCEQLIPSVQEVLKACEHCRTKGWEFVYATPYV